MTTSTEVTSQETTVPPETPRAAAHAHRRSKWDAIIVTAGIIYILLVLSLNLDMPFMSLVFISMAVHQLLWRDAAK